MTHLRRERVTAHKYYCYLTLPERKLKGNFVVGLGNNNTQNNQVALVLAFSSSSLSLCLCVLWGVPNRSGDDAGGMSWVLLVNYSKMAYRMNKLEKNMVALRLKLLLFQANPIFVLSDYATIGQRPFQVEVAKKTHFHYSWAQCTLISLSSPHSAPTFLMLYSIHFNTTRG